VKTSEVTQGRGWGPDIWTFLVSCVLVRRSVNASKSLFTNLPVLHHGFTAENPAGILGDAEADPEGLDGGEGWSPLGKGTLAPEKKLIFYLKWRVFENSERHL